jgi:hypothetical protein
LDSLFPFPILSSFPLILFIVGFMVVQVWPARDISFSLFVEPSFRVSFILAFVFLFGLVVE